MTRVHVRHPRESPSADADVDLVWGSRGHVRAAIRRFTGGLPADPPVAARDLFTFAASAYVTDKALMRSDAADRWTRNIELCLPLLEPGAWPITASEKLLHRLTGDLWTIVPRTAREPLVDWAPQPRSASDVGLPAEVALFSGGLDSTSYLAEVATKGTGDAFVGHADSNAPTQMQRRIFSEVAPDVPYDSLKQFTVQLAFPGSMPKRPKESTTRARATLFIAAGVALAGATGRDRLVIPENGFVSLNLPLGPARVGSLSTRTTHPSTINLYQQLLDELGLRVAIAAPYMELTKGEVLIRGRDSGLTPSHIAATLSCARPAQARWQGEGLGNCGYCYSCLVRRASLEASGGDPTQYRRDPRSDDAVASGGVGVDFRALTTWLSRPLRKSDVFAAGPLRNIVDGQVAYAMLTRGRDELRAMVENGLSPPVRATIGW